MADNVQAEAVVTPGATFATDDDGTAQHPYVKIEWGANNVFTKVDSGAGALPIQDGGNSITVDNPALSVVGGGVEATAVRVTIANDSTGVLSVDDNGGSLTVDGTVTANAGTNLNTSALALETGGNLAAAATSLALLDNIVSGSEAQVDVVAALPAGDNNIGNVDLASAIPAGTNHIGSVGHGKTLKSVTGATSTTATIVAAVASKKIKVYKVSLLIISTTAVTVTFKSGAAGTALATYPLQSPASVTAGIAEAVAVPSQLFETAAGALLELAVSAAVSVTYNVSYWDDDAT